MNRKNIIIGDLDEAYLSALSHYLMGSNPVFSISAFSNIDGFENEMETFDLCLVTSDFLECVQDHEAKYKKILVLLSTREEPTNGYDSIYKFQSMDTFMDEIEKRLLPNMTYSSSSFMDSKIISVSSPIYHELRLPFALATAKILSESGRTLFVDMEENSVLSDLIGENEKGDIIDLIYRLSSGGEYGSYEDEDLRKLFDDITGFYEGFYYLSPANDAVSLYSVSDDDWRLFIDALKQSPFEHVIILSDHMNSGVLDCLVESRELLLVSKKGDFYKKSDRKYEEFLKEREISCPVKEIPLSLSAGSLTDGTYELAQLLEGKLGNLARKAVSDEA